MIWLAWRQLRTQAVVVGALLVALAVALAVTGPHLVHLYDTTVASCAAHDDCASVTAAFDRQADWIHGLTLVVMVLPVLLGAFWGAPLVARELEAGSFRLAWTQGVTRRRWLGVKLALVGLASMVAAGLASLMVTWWASPYDRLLDSPFGTFDQRGVVPVAYALFAFVLGVTAGVLVHRTLPAMATTLAAFITVRYAVGQWVRLRLASTVQTATPFTAGPGGTIAIGRGVPPGAFIISENVVDPAGRVVGQNGGIGVNGSQAFERSAHGSTTLVGVGRCPNRFPSGSSGAAARSASQATDAAFRTCLDSFHLRQITTYQPVGHYWPIQWYEAGIFVLAALVLAAFDLWWVRRRIL